MMPRFEIHQKDPNEDEIIDALRNAGAWVKKIGRPVDLLVECGGVCGFVEVKAPGSKRITEDQVAFFKEFKGPVVIARTPHDAIEFVQQLRKVSRVGIWTAPQEESLHARAHEDHQAVVGAGEAHEDRVGHHRAVARPRRRVEKPAVPAAVPDDAEGRGDAGRAEAKRRSD